MASYHCCVPQCTNDSRYNKALSFHSFPVDVSRKKQWLIKIRRDEGPLFKVKAHTKVCSAHFLPEDFVKTLMGMNCLRKPAVPLLFPWTESTPGRKPPTPRLNPRKQTRLNHSSTDEDEHDISIVCQTPETTPQPQFHDYIGPEIEYSSEEKLAEASQYIKKLESQMEKLSLNQFGIHRFATDPKQLLFYTGFGSYTLLMNIFHLLRPTAENMTRWSQIKRQRQDQCEQINTDMTFHNENLQLVDQFFLFLVKIRLGLFQQDLACRFNVSQSTVSRIIITWSNFLASLSIWPCRAKVDKFMPECFTAVYPSTLVILDCTELNIQTPSSLSLNFEFYSHYKGMTTFKCLIGISPAGCVTFV